MLVNGWPLECFHFQGLRLFPGGLVLPQAIDYGSSLSRPLQDLVYRPYLQRLWLAQSECRVAATSRRYSVSPHLLTVYRSRGNERCWVRIAGQFIGFTRWNALLLVTILVVRRILGK